MIIKKLADSPVVNIPRDKGVHQCHGIGPNDGSNELVSRHFDLEPGALSDADEHTDTLTTGDYVYIDNNEIHQFQNTSSEAFKFICVIPPRGEVWSFPHTPPVI